MEKERKRGSIEGNLLRIYQEAVKLEEKHKEMNATRKLLNHDPINILSSQKHLSKEKKKKAFIDPKHTHIH